MNREKKSELILDLEEMIGHRYSYGNAEYYIKSYRILEEKERIYLVTDKREFDRPFEAMDEFLKQFHRLPDRELTAPVSQSHQVPGLPERQITGSVIRDLKDVLLDNIKKIQANKDYIPQAEAVKNNVDSIIALAKTEVEYMSAMVKLNRI